MNVDSFWKLNEGLRPGNAEDQLRERLAALSQEEVVAYQEHFDRAFGLAYQWNLWAAAYVIEGGCSDDGFTDFRYGLISRGRSVFEGSIADPDSLVDVVNDTDSGSIGHESFGYVARELYESKTNKEMPRNDISHPTDPRGDEWDFDDEELCKQNLPKLWAKFGESCSGESSEPSQGILSLAGLIGWLRGRI